MKALKWIGIGAAVVALIVVGLFSYVLLMLPGVPPADPGLKIELTPERVKRGEYLARNVSGCMSCHSERSFDTWGFSPIEGTEFTGGFNFTQTIEDMPGDIVTPNLTLMQDHTDGELYRAITSGVRKDGEPMFPLMAYLSYGKMPKEDVYSIIAFLRSLKPSGEKRPPTRLAFPFSLIFRTIPQPPAHEPMPDKNDSVAWGRNIVVNQAACFDCHTPWNEKREPIPGMEGAGGGTFVLKRDGKRMAVRVANITPDVTTGIGGWTKETFLEVLRQRAGTMAAHTKTAFGTESNTIMPYFEFTGMTDDDIGAVYDYLRTLKPIKNQVIRWEALPAKG